MRLDEQGLRWLTGTPGLVEALFDGLPDVLFYIKDSAGRYVWANRTLIERAGLRGVEAVEGKTADQLFPVMGPSTVAQDVEVVRSGHPIREQLRLYKTHRGDRYWCLSSKFPLLDASQRITGLAGLSRDVPGANERHRSYHRLASFLDYIDARLDQPVRHFAYPVGDASVAGRREFEMATAAGYDSAVTTRPGMIFTAHAQAPMALPRLSVNGCWQRLDVLDVLLSGAAFAV